MPILLEHVSTPSPEDWQDLDKIHQDTQPNGLPSTEYMQQNPNGIILGARFNERLVGAIWAATQDDMLVLIAAGVRKATQKRGVMHQLLQLMCSTELPTRPSTLAIRATLLDDHLGNALKKRGFLKQAHKNEVYYTCTSKRNAP